jgi:hypothetical protein
MHMTFRLTNVSYKLGHVTFRLGHVTFILGHMPFRLTHETFTRWHVTFKLRHETFTFRHMAVRLRHMTCILSQVYLREKDYDEYSGGESYIFERTLRLVKDPLTHETLKDSDTGKELKVSKQQMDLLWYPQVCVHMCVCVCVYAGVCDTSKTVILGWS